MVLVSEDGGALDLTIITSSTESLLRVVGEDRSLYRKAFVRAAERELGQRSFTATSGASGVELSRVSAPAATCNSDASGDIL